MGAYRIYSLQDKALVGVLHTSALVAFVWMVTSSSEQCVPCTQLFILKVLVPTLLYPVSLHPPAPLSLFFHAGQVYLRVVERAVLHRDAVAIHKLARA